VASGWKGIATGFLGLVALQAVLQPEANKRVGGLLDVVNASVGRLLDPGRAAVPNRSRPGKITDAQGVGSTIFGIGSLLAGRESPKTKAAMAYIRQTYGAVVKGWRARGSVPNSDHPKGRALDAFTASAGQGDSIAAEFVRDAAKWGVKYVIWKRREWTPARGWHAYTGPDPHTGHVHISFN